MPKNLLEEIKEERPERVFIQLPEGLIQKAPDLLRRIEKQGIKTFLSLEPCYGACDLRVEEAKKLRCDLIVHIGHNDFGVESEIPVIYYPWKIDVEIIPLLKSNFDRLEGFEKIGLVTTVNFTHLLNNLENWLNERGKTVFIGKGKIVKERGQILGCDLGSTLRVEDKVDCFLYVGSGNFHPLGIALKSEKPVFKLDLEKRNLEEVDSEKFEKQKLVAIEKGKQCKKFGILVSKKPGQFKEKLAERIKTRLENKGREAWIFVLDRITQEKLKGLKVDCFVNTACPRIAIENRPNFEKPFLNPEELRPVLKSWK